MIGIEKNLTVPQIGQLLFFRTGEGGRGGAVLTESRLAIVLPCLPTCYRTCNYSGPPKYSARKFQTVYSLTQKWYNSPECAIHRYSWISNVLHRTILLYYYHHMRSHDFIVQYFNRNFALLPKWGLKRKEIHDNFRLNCTKFYTFFRTSFCKRGTGIFTLKLKSQNHTVNLKMYITWHILESSTHAWHVAYWA
jgi:hypothetical protein